MFGRRGVDSDAGLQDRLRGLNGRPDLAPPPPPPPTAPPPKPGPSLAPPMPQAAGAAPAASSASTSTAATAAAAAPAQPTISVRNASVADAVPRIYPLAIQRIDTEVAAKLERDELARQLTDVVSEIIVELKLQLNHAEQRQLVTLLLDDMLGLGPLEPLLGRRGHHRHHGQRPEAGLCRAQGQARADRRHLPRQCACDEHRHAHRHAGRPPHRRIDAAWSTRASPTAAASTSSSRRWRSTARRSRSANSPRRAITLDVMARQANISPAMATVLKIAARSPPQHPDLRRHRLGQDHAAQRHVADDRPGRAHRHHRGRGRTAAAAAACRAARNPAAQPRRAAARSPCAIW